MVRFSEKEYCKKSFQEVQVMIQIENLDYKMPKKYVEEDVDNGYKNKGL